MAAPSLSEIKDNPKWKSMRPLRTPHFHCKRMATAWTPGVIRPAIPPPIVHLLCAPADLVYINTVPQWHVQSQRNKRINTQCMFDYILIANQGLFDYMLYQ